MDQVAECKGCRASVRIPEREIERIITEYLRDHDDRVVTDDDYQMRMNTCQACPHLQYGTTCRHCGCLVALRAKLAGKGCPDPNPRWREIGN